MNPTGSDDYLKSESEEDLDFGEYLTADGRPLGVLKRKMIKE